MGDISRALAEAGIVLAPGEYLTADQYLLLPQWFRDKQAQRVRELIQIETDPDQT